MTAFFQIEGASQKHSGTGHHSAGLVSAIAGLAQVRLASLAANFQVQHPNDQLLTGPI